MGRAAAAGWSSATSRRATGGRRRTARSSLHPAAAAVGTERAHRVRALFAGVAERYDLVNTLASLGLDAGWRRAVATELALGPAERCLDACCGTGDLALAVTEGGGSALGLDFCRPMLAKAREKCSSSRVSLAVGDVLRLPLAAGSMDAACIGFGLRNLADPKRGLAELARVVRAGGRVAVLEFSRPRGRLIRAVTDFHARHVVPLVGDLVSGRRGTYAYLPETIAAWLEPEDLARLMADVGLRDVRFRSLSLGVAVLHVGTKAGPGGDRT